MYSTIAAAHQRAKTQTQALDRSIVFVVDDDVSVRESLELLIGSAGWQPLLFASAKDFLSHARPAGPSCLVLDVNMPGLNGLDLQSLLTTDGRRIPIIFVTGFGDVPTTVRAMKAGAFEFLTKPIDTAALLQAIRSAMERSAALTREDSELAALRSCYKMLSPREREVMFFVVQGLMNKQVAFELGISEITVKAHRGQLMRKMNAHSLPELVNMFARLRLGDQVVMHRAGGSPARSEAGMMGQRTDTLVQCTGG
jgi:FixJ family two-component response regulator